MFQSEMSVYVDAVGEELEELLDAFCDVLAERGYGVKSEDDDVRAFMVARPIEPISDTEQALEDWIAEAIAGGHVAAIPQHPDGRAL